MNKLAPHSFDLRTSGLWALRASPAPRCFCIDSKIYLYNYYNNCVIPLFVIDFGFWIQIIGSTKYFLDINEHHRGMKNAN